MDYYYWRNKHHHHHRRNSNKNNNNYHHHHHHLDYIDDDARAQSEAESLFDKKFSFQKPPLDNNYDGAWILPTAKSMFTQKKWLVSILITE